MSERFTDAELNALPILARGPVHSFVALDERGDHFRARCDREITHERPATPPEGIAFMLTPAAREAHWSFGTTNASKVTCKRCLRSLAAKGTRQGAGRTTGEG